MAVPQKSKSQIKAQVRPIARGSRATGKKTPPVKPAPVREKGTASANLEAAQVGNQQIEKAKAALKKAAILPPTKLTQKPLEASAELTKRPKTKAAKSKSRKISLSVSPGEAASELLQKWNSLFKKAEQIEAQPYHMKAVFLEKTAIVHRVLGWGYILANRNDRLEVLFKDGIKYLISNYKP